MWTTTNTAHDAAAWAVLDRLPEAISIVGPDGVHLHANAAAQAIQDELSADHAGQPVSEVDWAPIAPDGTPVSLERMPVEITRLTGEECSDVELGFPSIAGVVRWLRISSRRFSDDGPPFAVVASYTDVTDAHRTLSRATELFGTAFAEAPIGMALVALDGGWLRVNRALCDLVGYSEAELMPLTFQDITHPDDLDADLSLLGETIAGKRSGYQMQKRYFHADGRVIWAQLSVSLVSDEAGNPLHFVSQIQDVTERHGLEARLQELADHDPLTGLLNRRRLEEELRHQLARCARYGENAAMMIMDLDGFKAVNDTYGHAAGDAVLRDVAIALGARTRTSDTLARVGGDEFAAILLGVDDEQGRTVAEGLADAVAGAGAAHGVTASVGVAALIGKDTVDGALARADRAMYAAKRARDVPTA
jgi:diguanylate cyclase (GGDEF)-like protein/PAS domain S-box-containing protein